MGELLRLQHYAGRLKDLLSAAQASSPRQVEGADSTGTVRVVLGPDGLPAAIRVRPGWERAIAPAAFGGAVVQAFGAAVDERMAVWTRVLEDGEWRSEVAQLKAGLDGPRTAPAAPRAPGGGGGVPPAGVSPAFRRDRSRTRPRALDVVAEDALKAFGTVQEVTAAPAKPAEGTGTSAAGKLVLRLSATGVFSCEADPLWVSRQTAVMLTEALSQALADARGQLAEAARAAQGAAGQRTAALGRLFDEALAILEDQRRLSE